MQARTDKERYQQALNEYQQRLTLSDAGLEESQEEPFATYQPQGMSSPCECSQNLNAKHQKLQRRLKNMRFPAQVRHVPSFHRSGAARQLHL